MPSDNNGDWRNVMGASRPRVRFANTETEAAHDYLSQALRRCCLGRLRGRIRWRIRVKYVRNK